MHAAACGMQLAEGCRQQQGNVVVDSMACGVYAPAAAGRSVGVAKQAHIVAVRVLDCDGAGSISNVVAGGCVPLFCAASHSMWARPM